MMSNGFNDLFYFTGLLIWLVGGIAAALIVLGVMADYLKYCVLEIFNTGKDAWMVYQWNAAGRPIEKWVKVDGEEFKQPVWEKTKPDILERTNNA